MQVEAKEKKITAGASQKTRKRPYGPVLLGVEIEGREQNTYFVQWVALSLRRGVVSQMQIS